MAAPHHKWSKALIELVLLVLAIGCGRRARPLSIDTATPMSPSFVETDTPDVDRAITPTATAVVAVTESPPLPTETRGATPTSEEPPRPEKPTAHIVSPLSLDELLSRAERIMADGDYEQAIETLRKALPGASEQERPLIALPLARVLFEDGRHTEAIPLLRSVVTATLSPGDVTQAWGLLARSYYELGQWQDSIDAYREYIVLEDAAEPYVRWRIALALFAQEAYEEAVKEIRRIPLDGLGASMRAEILEEMAEALVWLTDYDGAVSAYEKILDFAKNTEYRALVMHKLASTYGEADQGDSAEALLQRILEEHPQSYAAYMALTSLDEMEATDIGDLQRGEILYHAGQYAKSIEVLRRYEYAHAEGELGRAYHTMGLSLASLGRFAEAFEAFDEAIRRHADDPLAVDTWLAKAEAASDQGGDPSGIYNEFWQRHQDHPKAPEALWMAASALEDDRTWRPAADYYQLLHQTYPEDSRSPEARFREGLAHYASGDAAQARQVWSEAVADVSPEEDSSDAADRARLLTWLGIAARATGDEDTASDSFREAARAAGWSYYGLRAQDLAASTSPYLSPDLPTQLPDDPMSDADWQDLTQWVSALQVEAPDQDERVEVQEEATSEGAPTVQATRSATEEIASDPLARRGTALLRIGLYPEAVETYRDLLKEVGRDASRLVSLARLSHDQGLYAISINCAERLLSIGRERSGVDPPRALSKLAYPTVFGHLVEAETERYGFDPLLFLALIRQESRFNPRAVSYAGARGLTQVMPATGEWIATRIGPDDLRTEMLSRPSLNVRYGTWFLDVLLVLYDRDWVAALVAYNAGPGNLNSWTNNEAIRDHDLFYETIPVKQAQDYVRLIYRQYRSYERIYR